jgi:hypothetical protein
MEGRAGPTASEVKGWGIDGEVTAVFPLRELASQIPPAPVPSPQQLRSTFHTSVFPGFRLTSRFFVVSGLSRHNSSIIPSRGLHDRFLNRYRILGFHKIVHHHLSHEDFDYATPTSPTTLEVEDGLARTPCPRRVE